MRCGFCPPKSLHSSQEHNNINNSRQLGQGIAKWVAGGTEQPQGWNWGKKVCGRKQRGYSSILTCDLLGVTEPTQVWDKITNQMHAECCPKRGRFQALVNKNFYVFLASLYSFVKNATWKNSVLASKKSEYHSHERAMSSVCLSVRSCFDLFFIRISVGNPGRWGFGGGCNIR